MSKRLLESVIWQRDPAVAVRGEPGIHFSYMGALASVLAAQGRPADPAWLMGASGWAFRIHINRDFCPSATSIFDWLGTLPEAVEQAGYHCDYHNRMWHEGDQEATRRTAAHAAILRAIDGGSPVIAWDLTMPEWGLITGYDDERAVYGVLECDGAAGEAPYASLGQREIRILSVAIVGAPNGRSRDEIVRRALETAVQHAEGGEWMDRPLYENGLAAYAMWAECIAAGRGHVEGVPTDYYAGHYYGARCYAREFLRGLAAEAPPLAPAAEAYARVAAHLRPVWLAYLAERRPADAALPALAEHVRLAAQAEAEAVAALKAHLARG